MLAWYCMQKSLPCLPTKIRFNPSPPDTHWDESKEQLTAYFKFWTGWFPSLTTWDLISWGCQRLTMEPCVCRALNYGLSAEMCAFWKPNVMLPWTEHSQVPSLLTSTLLCAFDSFPKKVGCFVSFCLVWFWTLTRLQKEEVQKSKPHILVKKLLSTYSSQKRKKREVKELTEMAVSESLFLH